MAKFHKSMAGASYTFIGGPEFSPFTTAPTPPPIDLKKELEKYSAEQVKESEEYFDIRNLSDE